MPSTDADPYAELPDRTPLTDDTGRLALVFSHGESVPDATPWADAVWVPPGISTTTTAGLVRHALAGWLFSTTDSTLATTLIEAGAAERRHALVMTYDLQGAPSSRWKPTDASPDGVVVRPLSAAQTARHAGRLGVVHLRAYPAGHPDARAGSAAAARRQLQATARGEVLGPMSDVASTVAIAAGAVVGACLVVDRAGPPPLGGPWILDVFRDPDVLCPGIGRALLEASLHAATHAGLPALSLAVSASNLTARGLYSRLGFVDVEESWTLALPEPTEPEPT